MCCLFLLSGAFVQSSFCCPEFAICVTIHLARKVNVGHMPFGESRESETSPNPSKDFEDHLTLIDDVATTPNGFILIFKSIWGFWGSPHPDWWCYHHTKWFSPHHHIWVLIRFSKVLTDDAKYGRDNDVDNFNQMRVKISLMVQFNGVAASLIVCSSKLGQPATSFDNKSWKTLMVWLRCKNVSN